MDRIRDDLEFWVTRTGADHLRLYDGNFFLGRQRLMEFSRLPLLGDLAGDPRSVTGLEVA